MVKRITKAKRQRSMTTSSIMAKHNKSQLARSRKALKVRQRFNKKLGKNIQSAQKTTEKLKEQLIYDKELLRIQKKGLLDAKVMLKLSKEEEKKLVKRIGRIEKW